MSSRRPKYEDIKTFVEENGCKLITEEYKNQSTKMEFKCACGSVFITNFREFKHGNKRQCNDCGNKKRAQSYKIWSYEEVVSFAKESGCEIITKKEDYINVKAKISIKCKCGKPFNTKFQDFVNRNKRQCNECGRKNGALIQMKTHETFIQELKEIRPDIVKDYKILSEYHGSHRKIKLLHKHCNSTWEVTPNDLISEKSLSCGHCSKNKQKTHREFVREVYDRVGCEYSILGIYKKSTEHIKIKHNKCGHVWYVQPTKFISKEGTRCPMCIHNSRVDYAEIVERASVCGCNVLTKECEYNGVEDILTLMCSCGNVFKRKIFNLEKGNGMCMECSLRVRGEKKAKTHDEFADDFYNVFNKDEYEIVSKYTRSFDKIKIKHTVCGNTFSVRASDILNKPSSGCRICNASSYERIVYSWLYNNINPSHIEREKTFEDLRGAVYPLRYDFCIYGGNGKIFKLIEVDGEFHHINMISDEHFNLQKRHDKLKDEYALKNNYSLIRIPYWDINNVEEILGNNLKDLIKGED